jgi:hypothetical protein
MDRIVAVMDDLCGQGVTVDCAAAIVLRFRAHVETADRTPGEVSAEIIRWVIETPGGKVEWREA